MTETITIPKDKAEQILAGIQDADTCLACFPYQPHLPDPTTQARKLLSKAAIDLYYAINPDALHDLG